MMRNNCNGMLHVVRENDTLYSISRRYNVPLAIILRANPYVDIYNLQIGDEICIPMSPAASTPTPLPLPMPEVKPELPTYEPPIGFPQLVAYIIKDRETIEDILEKFGIDLDDLLEYNNLREMLLKPGITIKVPSK